MDGPPRSAFAEPGAVDGVPPRKCLWSEALPPRRRARPLALWLLLQVNMDSVFILDLPGVPEGAQGRIVEVSASGTDRQRLAVLGLCVGRIVEVVQSGDPVIVRVLGTRIGLAGALARSIRVETS